MVKRALVTGVTGQDGHALAQQLIAAGQEVYGLVRWASSGTKRTELARDIPDLHIIDGDITDEVSIRRAIEIADPDVIYNLAALASSGQSWAQPMMMAEINALGPLKILEAIRRHNPNIRFVQASTSEQYGRVNEIPQSEWTPFGSLNVYGVAKTFAHQATINYRDGYGLHASTILMHNHVSLRRDPYFVDRKITRAAARIAAGLEHELLLGNTGASRDWGWGPEYMQAWQLVGEHDRPGDYVLATGKSHTVHELLELAFSALGLRWADYVRHDEALMRPTDVAELRGDATHIRDVLGWEATVSFDECVGRLIEHDLTLARREAR